MRKKYIIFWVLLTVMITNSGCDFLRGMRRQIRGVLFGHEKKIERKGGDSAEKSDGKDTGAADLLKINSEKENVSYKESDRLVEITPIKKVYNLCNAYAQSPGVQMKDFFLAELENLLNDHRELAGSADFYKEITFCFNRVLLIIENDADAMDLVLRIYVLFDEQSRKGFNDILAKAFDYWPVQFVKKYAKVFKYQQCSFITALSPGMDVEAKDGIWARRVGVLRGLGKEISEKDPIQNFIESCISVLTSSTTSTTNSGTSSGTIAGMTTDAVPSTTTVSSTEAGP
ncbi:MAG: hypothetical protein HQK53_04180 [Oligoflexia bacterium]|nr:hypothetical protein [Oligoflexia bacterium]